MKKGISEDDIRTLVGRASTLEERRSAAYVPEAEPQNEQLINARISRWNKAVGAQTHSEEFRPLMGAFRLANAWPLPRWACTLKYFLEKLGGHATPDASGLMPSDPLPFQDGLLPFVIFARSQLYARLHQLGLPVPSEFDRSLCLGLLRRLAEMWSLTFDCEFSKVRAAFRGELHTQRGVECGDQQYREFIHFLANGGIESLVFRYPVLARITAIAIDQWVDSIVEVLERLTADRRQVESVFRRGCSLESLQSVMPDLSDRHLHGRSVMLLEFKSGFRLVYKPRHVGMEEAWFSLLTEINSWGTALPLQTLKILNRGNYGWVEFVRYETCLDGEMLRRFYRRAGMLLFLAHLMRATDLHLENMIACGEQPVLIDLETLMQPSELARGIAAHRGDARTAAANTLTESVLRTGLLPRWEHTNDGKRFDASALGAIHQQTSFRVPCWQNINTDRMMLDFVEVSPPISNNAPGLDHNPIELGRYVDDVAAGFEDLYRMFLARRGQLLDGGSTTKFVGQHGRFILRGTKVYGLLLDIGCHPSALGDGAERSIHFAVLHRSNPEAPTDRALLVGAELQALHRQDIPFFITRSDSAHLALDSGELLRDFFGRPGYSDVLLRIKGLNESDLGQQIFMLRGSFYSRLAQKHRTPTALPASRGQGPPPLPADMVRAAAALAEAFRNHAIRADDGAATWIVPQYSTESQDYQLQPMNSGLYDGLSGAALFLAALEKVTGGAGFRDLALAALRPLRGLLGGPEIARHVQGLTFSRTACGSIIYSLVRIAEFLDEPALIEDASRAANLITHEEIAEDRLYHVLAGAADAILGLLALWRVTSATRVLEMAIECGFHLCRNRTPAINGYRAWRNADGNILTGFSHGASGVSYALARLYQASSIPLFLEVATEGCAFETAVFDRAAGNWPDFRFPADEGRLTYSCSWCHGASGIGLARLGMLGILDPHGLREHVTVAVETTLRMGVDSDDVLCCGNFGRLELVFTAANRLSREDWQSAAMGAVAEILARSRESCFGYGYSLPFHPGFFQGAAGIGYQLLRMAHGASLPSVLLWE